MSELKNYIMITGVPGAARFWILPVVYNSAPTSSYPKLKISKQSALAVTNPLEIININPSAGMC